MKSVRDIVTADVVWVSPSARVKTAVILMKGHNIGALPVVQADNQVVGIVTLHDLLGEPDDAAISDVMSRDYTSVDPNATVFDAAELMHSSGSSHLLMIEDGKLAGIVSHGDLMPELGKTFDPLTKLPWSDTFREWAMNALKRGIEISVIFFDLDQFGLFNKKHGHVVGDNVLKEVAEVFKKSIDPETDLACRYGGDEFVVVSVRNADDATALGRILHEKISKVKINGIPDSVSGSYGIFGGRRTKEREDVHYAATIDDLITCASKRCTAHKPHRVEAARQAPAPQPAEIAPGRVTGEPIEGRAPRLKVQSISLSTTDMEASVSVTLSRGGREFKRESSGYAVGGINVLRLTAEAAAGAACQSLAPGHGIVVDDVALYNVGKEDQVVTVVAVFISPRFSARHVGSAMVRRGDHYRAAAAAMLAAVNRYMEAAPQSSPDEI